MNTRNVELKTAEKKISADLPCNPINVEREEKGACAKAS
jgi:hypothetical protein